jgi:hypothetical protein
MSEVKPLKGLRCGWLLLVLFHLVSCSRTHREHKVREKARAPAHTLTLFYHNNNHLFFFTANTQHCVTFVLLNL